MHNHLEDHFWLGVGMGPRMPHMETPCWIWIRGGNGRGYGKFHYAGEVFGAHRISYELHCGKFPRNKKIDHRCHNKRCVRPEHLRVGTQKQNLENLPGAQRNSQSGVLGVSPYRGKWRATVGHNYKQIRVGVFGTLEEASAAVVAKRNELFTYNDLDRI